VVYPTAALAFGLIQDPAGGWKSLAPTIPGRTPPHPKIRDSRRGDHSDPRCAAIQEMRRVKTSSVRGRCFLATRLRKGAAMRVFSAHEEARKLDLPIAIHGHETPRFRFLR
jgi:hypothetical protein